MVMLGKSSSSMGWVDTDVETGSTSHSMYELLISFSDVLNAITTMMLQIIFRIVVFEVDM